MYAILGLIRASNFGLGNASYRGYSMHCRIFQQHRWPLSTDSGSTVPHPDSNSGHCQNSPRVGKMGRRKTQSQVENLWLRQNTTVNFLKWDSMYICSWKQNLEISHTTLLVQTQPHCLGLTPELKLSISQFPKTIRKHIFLPPFLLP